MVFMVLCGVNFNLYYLAFKDGISQLFKDSEFRFYLLIFGVSAFMIATILFVTGKNDSIGGAAVDAAFQTASILTTTGYMSSDYEVWPFICQMILFFLMIVGGCSFLHKRRTEGDPDPDHQQADPARDFPSPSP